MLPKVAGQIIHHTSRAVYAVHNQGHTIRNVLQSGPSVPRNGSGSSSSGWNNGGGPGTAGGSFFHSNSSRFYSGYTGVGRAVTQADPSASSHSGTADPSDESNELQLVPSKKARLPHRQRVRSSSVSLGIRGSQGQDSSGVLTVIKYHVRSRHAFAAPPLPSSSTESKPALESPIPNTEVIIQETYIPTEDIADEEDLSGSIADGGHVENPDTQGPHHAMFIKIADAQKSGDINRLWAVVKELGATEGAFPALYNSAIQALISLRSSGEPLDRILDTYNEMLQRSIHPNFGTYNALIQAFTTRDHEVCRAIVYLEQRIKTRQASGYFSWDVQAADEQALDRLRAENNFGSALKLFQAAISVNEKGPHFMIYSYLLRSCADHANIDAAIHVFAQLEKRTDLRIQANIFNYLIITYARAGDIRGSQEVFEEYKKGNVTGKISWIDVEDVDENVAVAGFDPRFAHIAIYNHMIQAYFLCGQPLDALHLLEEMLDSPAGVDFTPTQVPPPSAGTYAEIIAGFCRSGDVKSALSWFDKLMEQQDLPPTHRLTPTTGPVKPNELAVLTMVNALGSEGMIDDLNRVFTAAAEVYPHFAAIRYRVFRANVAYLDTHPDIEKTLGVELLDFAVNVICAGKPYQKHYVQEFGGATPEWDLLTKLYLRFGSPERALVLTEEFVESVTTNEDAKRAFDGQTKELIQSFCDTWLANSASSSSLDTIARVYAILAGAGIPISLDAASRLVGAYAQVKASAEQVELSPVQWGLLIESALLMEQGQDALPTSDFANLADILVDVAQSGVDLSHMSQQTSERIISSFVSRHPLDVARTFFAKLGPSFELLFDSTSQVPQQVLYDEATGLKPIKPTSRVQRRNRTPPPERIRSNPDHSTYVDEFRVDRSNIGAQTGYARFEEGLKAGLYPNVEVIARLINPIGRLGELDKVRRLYDAAQVVLDGLEAQKDRQSSGWFAVENAMIIALAHAGDTDAAHVHRLRILEQGGVPNADAYGALIQRVKDTTDDTANAMMLFQEGIQRGVVPNTYLYNTIISKLARARKADYALELFQEMKARGFLPTSVTYGTVIAACCRVGDSQSAEILFEEMASQSNFKPRVPPYNTMMQLYTHTKPDRERVLYYYDALLKAGVQPTAHTYKLLIDAYGTIQPVDMDAMQKVCDELLTDRSVSVHGTHWAALINAWGCVKKDLDKAVAIFDSIATHPSTKNRSLPDAVCFEALLNVLVTLRRTDLISTYAEKLTTHGVHMTAYIANLLIKGYAAEGNIERAREVFESLVDPPQGVAAANNHASHDGEIKAQVPAGAPVYREPSTWEAMVRAELGNGNRDRAVTLLDRVQERRFPTAVYNRISGIMLDDSVSPWASSPSDTISLQSQQETVSDLSA